MAGTIASYQNSVRFAGESTEVSVVVKRDGVAVARTPQDFCQGSATCHLAAVHAFLLITPLSPLSNDHPQPPV